MSIIAAGNTTTTALVQTADTTGNLVFTTGGANTTALTITNAQAATFAGAVNITGAVTQTGNATFSANVSVAGSLNSVNTFGFKNRIINGNMTIDQRNAGASVTPTGANPYGIDRWSGVLTQASKYSFQQNAGAITPPTGYINYLGVTSLSAYAVLAGDTFALIQSIEGLNIADLAWGTANAKTVTLSFQVYSSLTGTFGGSLINSAANRSYVFSYSIPTANTWTQISITISGDTSGTWLTTNGIGISVRFGLGSGSTYSGTAGSWGAGNIVQPTGSVSVVGTSGATFYITGVQLEVGSQATSFDFRDYGRELILCQRYFYKTFPLGTVPAQAAGQAGSLICPQGAGAGANGNSYSIAWQFKAAMRTAPTIALYTPTAAGGGNWYDSGGGSATTSGATNTSEFSTTVYNVSAAGNVNTNAVIHATASAEL